ncbi:MAG: uroporphyrinogen-III synthase [Galactobacter sp.]
MTESVETSTRARVGVLRAPARQWSLVSALLDASITPVACPLIDHELPQPGPAAEDVDQALEALRSGACAWVAFTSATTVAALRAMAARSGTTLEVAQTTRVAAVGRATAAALTQAGIPVDLVPETHSAVGLVDAWPTCEDTAAATVLLPSSALAASTLADGLLEKGWRPRPVTAYTTVQAPADPDLAFAERPDLSNSGIETLTPQQLTQELSVGTLDSAILTSPSTARRVVHLLDGKPCATGFIAIGPRTAAEATVLGLRIDAIAADTTPEALAAALAARAKVRDTGI